MARIDRETGLAILEPQAADLAPGITIAMNDEMVKAMRANLAMANAKEKVEILVVHNMNELVFKGSLEEFYGRLMAPIEIEPAPNEAKTKAN